MGLIGAFGNVAKAICKTAVGDAGAQGLLYGIDRTVAMIAGDVSRTKVNAGNIIAAMDIAAKDDAEKILLKKGQRINAGNNAELNKFIKDAGYDNLSDLVNATTTVKGKNGQDKVVNLFQSVEEQRAAGLKRLENAKPEKIKEYEQQTRKLAKEREQLLDDYSRYGQWHENNLGGWDTSGLNIDRNDSDFLKYIGREGKQGIGWGNTVKGYFGDVDYGSTRMQVAGGAYAVGAVGMRYLSGGNLTTAPNGEKNIAGIPFV